MLRSLGQQLAKELGSGIGIACRDVDGDPEVLWPVERAAIMKAIPRRQREFAAGRMAARDAMAQIGWPAEAIPSAPDRSPIWPKGLLGSIAHSTRACVAIAGHCDQVHAIGIDIEEDVALNPALWDSVCTPGELMAMASLPQLERGRWATRFFCIKEAFYKWQYPQTERMLDFCDVQVTLSRNQVEFDIHPVGSGNFSLPSCQSKGRLLTFNGLVLAWLIGPPALQVGGQRHSSAPTMHPNGHSGQRRFNERPSPDHCSNVPPT